MFYCFRHIANKLVAQHCIDGERSTKMHKNEHRKVHRRKEWSVDIAYRVKYTMEGSEVNEKNTRISKKR